MKRFYSGSPTQGPHIVEPGRDDLMTFFLEQLTQLLTPAARMLLTTLPEHSKHNVDKSIAGAIIPFLEQLTQEEFFK